MRDKQVRYGKRRYWRRIATRYVRCPIVFFSDGSQHRLNLLRPLRRRRRVYGDEPALLPIMTLHIYVLACGLSYADKVRFIEGAATILNREDPIGPA